MPNPNQVRIVVIDYYMSSPIPGLDLTYSEFRSSAITHVPVLRCFGSDKNGKKTCVHIHGVFPYLYIPYNGKGNSEEHMYKIAMALDKAINISFNQASSNAQHVYKICLVSGIPMYGYHLNQHQFFKIFLYNPALIAKVGDILLRRTALDEIYQPHEAHLNFTLQFMIDYNLHGMSSMLISDIKYRTNPDEKYSDLDETLRRPNIIKRTSICELEGDINAEHILNRQETVGVNPGIAALWDDEKQRRRNKGENSQLGNFLELQDIDTDSTKTHLIFQQSLRERLAVLVTNEDIQKQSLDVSIYPAEIPRHTKSNFQNASQIDIHSTSSLELSLDETFSVTCSQGLYDTITPNESQFDVSLDEEAQEFLNMLQHMANDKGAQNGVEEDEECILSQVEAEDVNDDSNEHFLDLSMPLESLATPTKSTNENILQLDGFVDDWLSDSDNESLATLRKKWHCEQPSSQLTENVTSVRLKCSKSMPLLESTCQVHKNQNNLFKHKKVQPDKLKLNVVVLLERIQVEKIANIEPLDLIKTLNKNVAAVKYPYFNKRSPEDIFEDNMRLIKFRMERLISRRKLKVIGDKLRIKYKKAVKLSKKISLSPKFNLVSAKRRWLGVPTKRSRGESNNYSASEIVIQRTSSTPNMYFNCDGLLDSTSSDDEQGLGSKEKKSVKQPLDIIVKNSPRILENFQRGVAKNLPKADESDKYFQQTSAEETVILCTPSRAPDKRKHSFESRPLINKTISEYLQPTSVSNATTTSNEFMESSKEENLNLEVIRGQRKKTRNELVSKMEISNNRNYSSTVEAAHISEPVPYDLHIFCNDEKLNRSFFKSYLSVSEKYDIMQGYRTKQGCSTLLTQSSFSNSTVVKRCQDNKIIFNNSRLAKLSNQKKNFSIMNRVSTFTTFKPASKAPTKAKVKSTLLKYGIPKIRPEEPFYNNVEDEKGAIEMGHRTLRISSKTTAHLAEFQSKYDGFNKYRKKIMEIISKLPWNSNTVSTLKISHCEDRRIIIRPLKKPPRIVSVKSWLVENVNKSENSVTEGHDYEANVTLSLTYCPPQFEISGSSLLLSQNSTSSVLEPSRTNSLEMLKLRDSIISSGEEHNSYEITGISQKLNKSVQNLQVARATTEHQYLTTMVMELHIRTRGDFKPDPQYDPICAIFYSILNDSPDSKSNINGVIAIDNLPEDQGSTKSNFFSGLDNNCAITFVDAEISLFQSLVNLVKHWDPDIITGYEIEMLSWGYLIERAYVLSFDIIPMLGRSQLHRYGKMKFNRKLVDSLETSIIGRILLNVWRIMRQEIALQSYTFESIAYHILNRRISMFCFKQLTYFWDHRTNHYRHRVVNYYLLRVDTVLELFNKLDFLNRTSELAKLFGILFYEVLSRGSQFRVESMMLRLAKPLNYVPVSPSTEQRSKMKAPEYIPLVMEPESKLYTDPVIVLDFQSLYPSIIIAYNYCFTTCIGRVKYLGTNHPFEFGASQLKVPRKVVEKLCKRDLLNFSPCGVAFVKRKVREGILPRMLKEVLETRFMVKNAMKENKGNENLLKVLHNRQLGLKLIANVTYGYTAANFSGRMCCVEVGDSVVSKGRETLEHAIAVVEENAEWEAKVVYGDTDSLFVLTPGKSKEEAFEIGRKIANAITKVNPDPVKLKLEKVYQPCILQTKKRYVGFMYESADQNEPVYEAKGIETVRRDGCPAVTKMLQKCLTLLFKTKDISLIKSYVLKQFNKIQAGRVSIQDLTFAKEYRGFTNYKPEACVPALELTRKWLAIDRRNEPRRGERVPYIVVNGPPSLPLIKLVRSPRELLNDNSLRPNVLYYISKVIIPPINRCLNLIGVDLNNWFHEMPRKTTLHLPNYSPTLVKSTISQYFISKICACCATPAQEGLCANCLKNPHISVLRLSEKLKKWEQNYHDTLLICQTCSCSLDEVVCNSLDCPVLYRRYQTISDHQQSSYVRELLNKLGAFSYDQWF